MSATFRAAISLTPSAMDFGKIDYSSVTPGAPDFVTLATNNAVTAAGAIFTTSGGTPAAGTIVANADTGETLHVVCSKAAYTLESAVTAGRKIDITGLKLKEGAGTAFGTGTSACTGAGFNTAAIAGGTTTLRFEGKLDGSTRVGNLVSGLYSTSVDADPVSVTVVYN